MCQEKDIQIEKLFNKLDNLYFSNNDVYKDLSQAKIVNSALK
jgi:hypothetical protein